MFHSTTRSTNIDKGMKNSQQILTLNHIFEYLLVETESHGKVFKRRNWIVTSECQLSIARSCFVLHRTFYFIENRNI